MAVLNEGFVDGAFAVARAVARQAPESSSSLITSAVTSALSSITTSPSPTDSATITSAPSTTMPTLTTSPDPSTSATSQGNQNQGGTSSPLLFFVALGFGVVFTNLWIIVGVKYCFRYNARNRQMRGLDENGEPINLENMPARPHRRRREKKLMTMDEVNDKFPMMKYKTWVADRAKEGLPTAGGVSVPPSRANSVRSVQGIVPEVPSKELTVTDATMTAAGDQSKTIDANVTTNNGAQTETNLTKTQTAASIITKDPDLAHASDDDDDDDQINAAVPPELLASSGDTCAICIDALEDDDDVRGLTCGHAFHAVCLDPWLTNRRACCPLCKADYYTPKPRPPPTENDPNNPASTNATDATRNNGRMNMPRQPQRTLGGWSLRDGPRAVLGRYGNTTNIDSQGRARGNDRDRRRQGTGRTNGQTQSRATSHATRTATAAAQDGQPQESWTTRLRSVLTSRRASPPASSAQPQTAGATADTTTPSQLEAGTRTS